MQSNLFRILTICILFQYTPVLAGPRNTCTYRTYTWNVHQRKAIPHQTVQHPYKDVSENEIHKETGCTVCEEDQVEIVIPGINRFYMCKHLAGKVEHSLRKLKQENHPITTVVGYRVGMTKGEVDDHGYRTKFSYHSFGIAIDINPEQNGLYDNCLTYGPQCIRIKGGRWHPAQTGSHTKHSAIVRELKSIGFKWGGEIEGKQKDFMHFSTTGY